jgi:TPR repeat protein
MRQRDVDDAARSCCAAFAKSVALTRQSAQSKGVIVMATRLSALSYLLCVIPVLALPCAAIAQDNVTPASNTAATAPTNNVAPIYDSADNADRMTSNRFGTPEDNARPGEYYFGLGANAFKRKDYAFAIDMYRVAASWAYKPAEYNLAVMYARGQGAPMDMPRAMAWMTLAAERGEKPYVEARELINAKLSNAQFAQADAIYGELYPTYGDTSALRRAKNRWAQVRSSMTGSRVGSLAGPLTVGGLSVGGLQQASPAAHGTSHMDTSAYDLTGGNQMDGTIAYRQLLASNDPYDPKFELRPGSNEKVTVEPLIPVKKSDVQIPTTSGNPPPADNSTH